MESDSDVRFYDFTSPLFALQFHHILFMALLNQSLHVAKGIISDTKTMSVIRRANTIMCIYKKKEIFISIWHDWQFKSELLDENKIDFRSSKNSTQLSVINCIHWFNALFLNFLTLSLLVRFHFEIFGRCRIHFFLCSCIKHFFRPPPENQMHSKKMHCAKMIYCNCTRIENMKKKLKCTSDFFRCTFRSELFWHFLIDVDRRTITFWLWRGYTKGNLNFFQGKLIILWCH